MGIFNRNNGSEQEPEDDDQHPNANSGGAEWSNSANWYDTGSEEEEQEEEGFDEADEAEPEEPNRWQRLRKLGKWFLGLGPRHVQPDEHPARGVVRVRGNEPDTVVIGTRVNAALDPYMQPRFSDVEQADDLFDTIVALGTRKDPSPENRDMIARLMERRQEVRQRLPATDTSGPADSYPAA